ncbi:MAG: carboxypeptidase-like regulatory domain-containing protein, partial [Bryobacteraceae bacterium]
MMRFVTGLLCAAVAAAQQLPQPDAKEPAGIEGRTLNAAGEPIRKANLTLRPMDTKPGEASVQPYAATSDAEGKFAFEAVEPGRYQLWAERPGYMRQAYGAKRNPMQGTMLTLSAGQHMKDVNITLMPQAVISGKVTDEDGDPVARVQVRSMRQAYMNGKRQLLPSGGGTTDDTGEFKMTGLSPGRYYLSAAPMRNGFFGENARPATRPAAGEAAKPEEAYVATYYPGVTDATAATPIEVAAGRDLPGINIRLQKSQVFRVQGKVAGGVPNQSVQRLRVMLMPKDGFMGSIGSISSGIGKGGSFDLHGVAPGS